MEPQKVLVQRGYQYDKVGNLTETNDLRMGKTVYRYDKLGQIQLAGQELFHFDPAHNLIEREQQKITNNQLEEYQDITYQYDEFGNLSQRTFPNGEVQYYAYNAKDQLIEATMQKPNQAIEIWQYQYDVLGRRISKRLKNGENLQETRFVWDGSHLIREENESNAYSYIYTHPSSYEPLAQLEFAKNSANPTACTTYYYHNDQIGVPRELTDEQGRLCWYGDYSGWGKLKNEYALVENIHQPFRLQNQYADEETGLHYNFFRYYEPNVGRFTQLDPIGLAGGENLYRFENNAQNWIDPLGLKATAGCLYQISKQELTCTRVENNGDTKTVSITKDDGVFSRRDEGTVNRIFRSRDSFYLHKGSVSWGCITVDKTNTQGMSKYSDLEKILKDVDSPKMTVVK